jgi:arabinofuranosyltransferase
MSEPLATNSPKRDEAAPFADGPGSVRHERPSCARSAVSRSDVVWRVALVLLGTAVIVAGFREFHFATDDAYIAFRYVRNLIEGRGLVWNPAPFHRVDGYTSFGWVMLLAGASKVTGRMPPEVCDGLSLWMVLATWVTFVVSAGSLLDRELGERDGPFASVPERRRRVLGATILGVTGLGLVTNRTFLTWTSSGLETAMFSFLVMAWTASLLRRRGSAVPAGFAALAALTRPEGLLLWGLTLIGLGWRTSRVALRRDARGESGRSVAVAWLLGVAPVVGHGAWHRVTYQSWLPNTYYAKVAAPKWRLGLRYVASFLIEFTAWPGLLWTLGAGALVAFRRKLSFEALVVAGFAWGLVAYYGLVVGGDHFEFKVFHALVPLYWLAVAWAMARAARLPAARALSLGLGAFLVLASWPIAWGHHLATRELVSRRETFKLRHAMAPYAPPLLRGYVAAYDAMQSTLIDRFYGMRHREHAAFFQWKLGEIPDEPPQPFDPMNPDVALVGEVGLLGYRYPSVAVIDVFGLNDRFIARYKRSQRQNRRVGHEAIAPPGYLEAFDANVVIEAGRVKRRAHRRPLTPSRVVGIERRAAAQVAANP